MGKFYAQHRIIHQTIAPYSIQQNRIAKRKNHTLKEMINAMLISYVLLQNMLSGAILSTNYI